VTLIKLPQCHVVRLLAALLTASFATQAAAILDFQQQRDLFKQAEQALEADDSSRFKTLTGQLADYPVTPYLHYDAMRQRLSDASPSEVGDFLERHEDYPFHYHLLSQWLNLLAERGDWNNYLRFYDGRNETRFRCQALTARLETGKTQDINSEIAPIWLSGYSQPEECDQPFEYFLDHADNAEDAIWQRIDKAFKARRSSLARYLGKKLDDTAKEAVDDWYRAHTGPEQWLQDMGSRKDTELQRTIILHALDRMAGIDSLKTRDMWKKIEPAYTFNTEQKKRIQQRLALAADYQHRPEAKAMLEELPVDLKNDNAHLWLARIHLRDEDWIGLIRTINAMPARLSKEAEWTYWLGRAYAEAGQEAKSRDILEKLANRSTYYGFLAADRSRMPYRIVQQQVTGKGGADENTLLGKNIHLLRARELFFLDRLIEARREWFQGIRKLNKDEIKQAAQMASSWKWHESAIKTVAKTGHLNDYTLRFPMPYQSQVMDNIKAHGLDAAVIYGVMRRESLFDPLAKSRVGALGLMQLMPSTARQVARALGLQKPGQSDILDIDNNIRLGTQYFKTVLDQFDNNVSLAAAAYNAGPKNVRKWLPDTEPMKADLWVETVPFKETRNYIQAVLAYATIFDRHLGQNVLISSRMADVKADY
jgi:soluble lytic murein transglycosylase